MMKKGNGHRKRGTDAGEEHRAYKGIIAGPTKRKKGETDQIIVIEGDHPAFEEKTDGASKRKNKR